MAKDWKDRLGVVYSTNPDYQYDYDKDDEAETLPPEKQKLHVFVERKGRKGKSVTIISGFTGTSDDLKSLGKLLKTKCAVGGSVKEGEIIIQGEFVSKVKQVLEKEGYYVK